MSIKLKLGIAIGSLSLIIIAMFLATLMATSSSKDDGLLINLAGRQRMLSQKMTKEIFFLAQERLKTGQDSPEKINNIKNTMHIFDMTLNALLKGGKAPLDLKQTEYRQCPPAREPAAGQLAKVATLWTKFSSHVDSVLADSQDMAALDWLQANNMKLLKEMNTAVHMMQIQAEKTSATLLTQQIFGIVAGVLFMIGAALTIMAILKRLGKIDGFAASLGQGDLTARIAFKNQDELGLIGNSLDHTSENLGKMFQKINTISTTLSGNADKLTTMSGQMTEVSQESSDKSASVAEASSEMSGNMTSVALITDNLNQQVSQVAIASQEAADNISTMAAASEEMSATVADIAGNTEQARTVTNQAMTNVQSASGRVDELGGAAQEINQITDVIVEIAEQTKLLALNATIEAARAGEAGKGFAVVANEIKELAAQTNNAIIEIRQKVEAMQNSTDNTINEINGINDVMNQVNEIVVNIAEAVEEQSVTTQDVARNIGEAVNSVQLMSQSAAESAEDVGKIVSTIAISTESAKSIAFDIEDVNQSSIIVKDASGEISDQAMELKTLGDDLKEIMGKFKM